MDFRFAASESILTTAPGKRFHELDSMRGLAALIVLLHHFVHMFYPGVQFSTNPAALMFYPFISGHESVMFFFILSGFVLALPFLRGKKQPYLVFLSRRILRIYGPYLAALLLALGGCALWHNRLGTGGWAAGTWFAPVTWIPVRQHLLLIGNYNYAQYNTAFWSLVYEMRISIIFPLLFLLANKLRTAATIALIVIFASVGIQLEGHAASGLLSPQTTITLEYIAVFLVGIVIAKNLDSLCARYTKLTIWQRSCIAVGSFALYFGSHPLALKWEPFWHLGDMPVAVGAAGILLVGINSPLARKSLNSPVPAFFGRISYSLYLVHGTVLFALAALWKGVVSPPVLFFLFLSTSVLASWGFYRAIELPFTRWSQRVGRQPKHVIEVPVMTA